MLDQAMIALASAGGAAVVQAAGTDAWQGFRDRVARLFGRGRLTDVQVTAERLDRTAAELAAADPVALTVTRDRAAASWQTRFEDLLESLDEQERQMLAAELRRTFGAAGRGIAVAGDVYVDADRGSAAAVVMGDVSITNPSRPDAAQA
ncbi:hypothetical protein [Yinghuangia seranimata]|uniref:hypothetical protein n=1 Tax=Yinghuangia seranimata TaxID=408067 RepID=UPI00248A9AC6|nr:hypothetical protein [Yinghuangia seranimata]MDI2129506.1 hypothetical protein [Yinghuangia seranimata]